MLDFRVITDLADCRRIWEKTIPCENIADLWAFRACFQRHFERTPHFLTVEEEGGRSGLLPLSFIEEGGGYGYFPGETWQARTWIEMNRLPTASASLLDRLVERCPTPYELRYLLPPETAPTRPLAVDEVGYLFMPGSYDHRFERYFGSYSRKRLKILAKDIAALSREVRYRYDVLSDYEALVALNLETFGRNSYFHDPRFENAFRDVLGLLQANGWLRLTTALIDGRVAAVDLGCVYGGTYTLLAGGTNSAFLGIAKVINLHHMAWACSQRLERVDFLCGDFSWKERFRLDRRPLYCLGAR